MTTSTNPASPGAPPPARVVFEGPALPVMDVIRLLLGVIA